MLFVEGVGGVAPGECIEFGFGKEVNVRVDDGVFGGLGGFFAGHVYFRPMLSCGMKFGGLLSGQ